MLLQVHSNLNIGKIAALQRYKTLASENDNSGGGMFDINPLKTKTSQNDTQFTPHRKHCIYKQWILKDHLFRGL
jgi:hypothetical protein